MKIPKKYSPYVFVFFVALSMSFIMSFALTAINLGFPSDFVFRWLKAWALAFPIAFLASVLVVPPIRKLVEVIVKQ